MKKLLMMVVAITFVVACCAISYAGTGPHGAAPNSGDGIPDGSGFEGHFGPNS